MYFTGLTLCSLHDYFALLSVRRWYLWFRPLLKIQVYNSSRVLVPPPYQRGDINFTYSTICSTSRNNRVMCFLSSIYRTPRVCTVLLEVSWTVYASGSQDTMFPTVPHWYIYNRLLAAWIVLCFNLPLDLIPVWLPTTRPALELRT